MAVEAGTRQDERVAGRVWTVRLDPAGRPSAGAVRLSCSRPACADERFPGGTAAGRRAAVGHVNMHLAHIRTGGGPRGEAWCACRTAGCAWHTPDPDAGRRGGVRPPEGSLRCGGPVVLAVYADRAGRLWRIAEMCARCAAATPGCRVLDTAPPPARATPAGANPGTPGGKLPAADIAAGRGVGAVFSDHGPAPAGASVPPTRTSSPGKVSRRAKKSGKIAQRIVPHTLEPDVLRLELIELGDAFRAYQERTQPDLLLLAQLHERKARAFRLWAEASGDGSLRFEAERAELAAQTTLEMHHNRAGSVGGSADGPVVERLLTRTQAVYARSVLEYVAANSPQPEAEVHLVVLMLTLRALRAGTGNLTGQDLTGWLRDDAARVLEQLVAADWLRLPSTVADAMDSRSEDPTAFTVPALLPEQPRPFAFGKSNRARISGWAQKVVGERKIRKKKLGATTRLLALYTAAHTRPDGHLGLAEDGGLPLDAVAAFCALHPEQITEHADLLVTADWLAEADTAQGRLSGQLTERVLPLGGLL